jgi:hypothetical protein
MSPLRASEEDGEMGGDLEGICFIFFITVIPSEPREPRDPPDGHRGDPSATLRSGRDDRSEMAGQRKLDKMFHI